MVFGIEEMAGDMYEYAMDDTFAAAAMMGAADDDAAKRALGRIGQGYLEPADSPDAMQFTPPSPARGSLSERRHIAASKEALKHHGKARWDLATSDADFFPRKQQVLFFARARSHSQT